MAITVKFFASFREVFGKSQVSVPVTKDVRALLDKLVEEIGSKLSEQFYEPGTHKLRDTVNILVNGRGISLLNGLNTPLKDGDTVAIFPPVSGG